MEKAIITSEDLSEREQTFVDDALNLLKHAKWAKTATEPTAQQCIEGDILEAVKLFTENKQAAIYRVSSRSTKLDLSFGSGELIPLKNCLDCAVKEENKEGNKEEDEDSASHPLRSGSKLCIPREFGTVTLSVPPDRKEDKQAIILWIIK